MKSFKAAALSWEVSDGVVELSMHRPPVNEIGRSMLEEFERFILALESFKDEAGVLIIYSQLKSGFSAGGDLREMYYSMRGADPHQRFLGVRTSIERSHKNLNAIDTSPLVTIAAVHGICFGGGFELALTCDLIVADVTARFCFPELRLGLIPGGGGIPRLQRDVRNGLVRDLLLTGRSINANRAVSGGVVCQIADEGAALAAARSIAVEVKKFDATARIAAKRLVKPIPLDELSREIEIFSDRFCQPTVVESVRKFVEGKDVLPYLP